MKRIPITETDLKRMEEYDLTDICAKGDEQPEHLIYEAGEDILREGMPIQYLYFVLKGTIKVCVNAENGKDLVLCHYVSEGILGDIELMTDLTRAVTSVVTITEFECIALPFQEYRKKLRKSIVFMNRLARELSLKLRQSSESVAHEALHSARERLCTYILQTSPGDVFREPLTDTACSIGTSYRHLLRMLRQLCEEGILQKTPSGYHIRDLQQLQEQSLKKNK